MAEHAAKAWLVDRSDSFASRNTPGQLPMSSRTKPTLWQLRAHIAHVGKKGRSQKPKAEQHTSLVFETFRSIPESRASPPRYRSAPKQHKPSTYLRVAILIRSGACFFGGARTSEACLYNRVLRASVDVELFGMMHVDQKNLASSRQECFCGLEPGLLVHVRQRTQ